MLRISWTRSMDTGRLPPKTQSVLAPPYLNPLGSRVLSDTLPLAVEKSPLPKAYSKEEPLPCHYPPMRKSSRSSFPTGLPHRPLPANGRSQHKVAQRRSIWLSLGASNYDATTVHESTHAPTFRSHPRHCIFPSMTLYACPGSCLFPLLLRMARFVCATSLAIGLSMYLSNPKHSAMFTAATIRSSSLKLVGMSIMSKTRAMERAGVRRM